AEAGSTVIVYDKGVEIGRVQADAAGNWSFTPVPPLQNGAHDITAKAQDKAGNIGDASNSIGFELIAGGNATAPAIIGAWDDVEAFTGLLQSGAKTNDARPELRGTAQAGESVTIIMDGKVQGTVVADGNGQWSWTPAADIPDGPHNFRAETQDGAGNPALTGNFQLVIDTHAPDAATGVVADDNVGPIVGPIGNGDTTDDSTPTIGGTGEPGGTAIIKDGDDVIGSTVVGDDGHWEFTPETPLPDGEHDIVVVIRDDAGNESAPSDPVKLIVDTGNVVVSIDYAYDDVEAGTGNLASGSMTNDDTPTLHGRATANSIITIMNGDVVLGSVKTDSFGRWSFTTPALQDGHYGFTATATDAKTGAISAPTAEFALNIDTQAPAKPGTGGTGGDGIGDIIDDVGPIQGSVKPGDVTDDTTPTLEGSGLQKGDVVSIIDNGEVIGTAIADENGGWQFTPNPPLNQGEHKFTIIVTDPAGNSSEPSDPYLIVVDTDAPAAPVIKEIVDDQGAVTGPINNGDTTDDAQPKISGTAEAGSTVIVYDKGVEIGRVQADAAGNWSFTPVPPLQNGAHDIIAKAQDKAGNIGDASNSIGFELLTGGVPSAPAIVNVIDDVGAITGNIRPGGVTDDTKPTIVGTAKPGNIVTIAIDGQVQGSVISDANGHWEFTPTAALSDGPHAIIARAKDSMGNTMPSSGEYNIIVDTIAPDVGSQSLVDNVGDKTGPIASGDTTDDSTPTYSGVAEPGSMVIIKDGDREIGRVPVNSKGDWSFTPSAPLPDGPHSLSHQVQDQAGNVSAASTPIDFVVDTSVVVVSITNVFDNEGSITGTLNTGSVTDDTSPTLNGVATANALVTIKNGNDVIGSVYADAHGNWQFTPSVKLNEGHYDFTASAEAENGSVAVSDKFELTIDITPPNNEGIGDIKDNVGGIVKPIQDGGLTDDTTPELGGSGQVPGDVVTIIDNGKPIGSTVVGDDGSWSYTPETPLPDGSHDFTIIVTDPAGNASQASDPWTVIVDTQAPAAPSIDTVWDDVDPKQGDVADNGNTNDKRPELRGRAAANATVIIYQDGIVKGSVTADATGKWKWTPPDDLSDATFNFTASQVSAAGVEGAQSTPYTITVDTLAPNTPSITSVMDNVQGGVVGAIASGGVTNDNRPTLSGTAEPNVLVKIFDGNTVVGSVYATATGAWSLE
ncbi:Ig-like domain-containing protein, partial [Pantoea dispersa]|uniref:Ig-like domain-containing protein n=1 Tax=Pantoea dispersa TaxID=59814 RepID=UPI002DB84FD0